VEASERLENSGTTRRKDPGSLSGTTRRKDPVEQSLKYSAVYCDMKEKRFGSCKQQKLIFPEQDRYSR
jgi:hypothetical protein